ncbi:extracellular matrix organizing protein FRAS1-like isoform X2 [Poecile atricapillus]|uniref:extracellular matrix organizing protein FRAS1-like isoform X2 n=1 Tax=Poecile atricapillus TaxID=48891 RepID=UPI00273995B6|nr:extracellular matrix organizing protein FRAS1-like isoform X2 [Poecile atricapillus]
MGRDQCPDFSLSEAGFLDEVTQDSFVLGPGYDRPYQLEPAVREPKSIQLYQHLSLKSCIWTFDAYYDMTELIDVCGGSVTADFQKQRFGELGSHHKKPRL